MVEGKKLNVFNLHRIVAGVRRNKLERGPITTPYRSLVVKLCGTLVLASIVVMLYSQG
jgi:hypothetical protein